MFATDSTQSVLLQVVALYYYYQQSTTSVSQVERVLRDSSWSSTSSTAHVFLSKQCYQYQFSTSSLLVVVFYQQSTCTSFLLVAYQQQFSTSVVSQIVCSANNATTSSFQLFVVSYQLLKQMFSSENNATTSSLLLVFHKKNGSHTCRPASLSANVLHSKQCYILVGVFY